MLRHRSKNRRRCQWCGPIVSATFPAFCRLARSSCFPESTGTTKTKTKTKHPTTELKCIVIIFRIQEQKNKKQKSLRQQQKKKKRNETNGCRAPAAVVIETGRDVVSFSIRQHISRQTFYDWTSSLLFCIYSSSFLLFSLALNLFLPFYYCCCCCCIVATSPSPYFNFVSRVFSVSDLLVGPFRRARSDWIYQSVNSRFYKVFCCSLSFCALSLWFIIDTSVKMG